MRYLIFVVVVFALFLAACGSQGMAVAPELVDPDAITARAFGNDECFLILAAAVPARLNPDAETATNGAVPAGEVEAVQAITLRDDGGLWYQLTLDGVWIRVDDTDHTTRGDCRP